MRPLPRTVRPSASSATSAPIAARMSRSASPGLRGALRPVRHGHPAAGDQRRGQERRGVGQVGLDLARPRAAAARARPARRSAARRRRPATPAVAQHVDGHPDVRLRRAAAAPTCRTSTPWSNRAPTAAGRTTNWLEDDASMCTGPPPAAGRCRHGERQRARPSSSTSAPSVAQRVEHGAHRPLAGAAGRRRSATGPSASAATGGRKRITVPGQPGIDRTGRAEPPGHEQARPGSDRPVGVVRDGLGAVGCGLGQLDPHRAQRLGHQQGVARAQRPAQPARPVGQGGEHQVAVGQRLAAGQPGDASTGETAYGAGQSPAVPSEAEGPVALSRALPGDEAACGVTEAIVAQRVDAAAGQTSGRASATWCRAT